jgi:predicted GNAT family acetyltransferase
MKIDLDKLEIVNNTHARRFETRIGDYFALINYDLSGQNIVFFHTEVPIPLEGQGIASKMAHTALEYARANNLKVIPSCPFIAAYIRKHPEYQPLVWGPDRHQ